MASDVSVPAGFARITRLLSAVILVGLVVFFGDGTIPANTLLVLAFVL